MPCTFPHRLPQLCGHVERPCCFVLDAPYEMLSFSERVESRYSLTSSDIALCLLACLIFLFHCLSCSSLAVANPCPLSVFTLYGLVFSFASSGRLEACALHPNRSQVSRRDTRLHRQNSYFETIEPAHQPRFVGRSSIFFPTFRRAITIVDRMPILLLIPIPMPTIVLLNHISHIPPNPPMQTQHMRDLPRNSFHP